MSDLPREVTDDIARRSRVYGVVFGLLCLPTAVLAGIVGSCCPAGGLLGVAPICLWAFVGGLGAAMALDWTRVPPEMGNTVGVKVGLRAGLLASVIGVVVTLLVAVLTAGVVSGSGAAMVAADPQLQGQEGAAIVHGLTLSWSLCCPSR